MLQNHVFPFNLSSIAEPAAVIPNGAKNIFANRTTTFINGPAILLNNEPKKLPDQIVLDIWVLGNFILADILSSNAFLNFACCLAVNNNSRACMK